VTGNFFTLGVFQLENNISFLQISFKERKGKRKFMIFYAEWLLPNPMVKKAREAMHQTLKKVIKPKFFLIYCIHAWRIKNGLRSTVDLATRRSTTDSVFQTPLTVLFLTVGGRSRIRDNKGTHLNS
jgi:hypothetical protein